MVSLVGALEGLQLAKILPALTYLAGCSGSCWGISVFMRMREKMPDTPLEEVAVSYTHLDVYKRQGKGRFYKFDDKPFCFECHKKLDYAEKQ